MMLLFAISTPVLAQEWQTVFSVDTRVGYSSNTYLNPYYSEWDRSANAGFGVVSGIGQTVWTDESNSLKLTGMGVVEPFFKSQETWKGGLGLAEYEHHFTNTFSAGVETGGSYFSSSFQRSLGWIQPKIAWTPTPFSEFTVKAGSNLRTYNNYVVEGETTDSRDRTDLYAVEFETWPNFRWQLTGGLYGNLDAFPAIQDGFSSFAALSHIFKSGTRIKLRTGVEQYANQQTITTDGGGGGFPPTGGGPNETTETIEETNRLFRLGVEGQFPINNKLSAFVNVEGLQYRTDASDQNMSDYQLSGGVRLSLRPASKEKAGSINPDWEIDQDQQQIHLEYSGSGQLYIVGDFNDWDRPGIPLVNIKKDIYSADLELDPGAYEYKVLIIEDDEEKWLPFSDDTYTVEDGFGGENAMLLIQ
ncbi:MAG: glycogen-binding domain-containing protein [Bacteroidota bacterium]